jgi:hypothetical protein
MNHSTIEKTIAQNQIFDKTETQMEGMLMRRNTMKAISAIPFQGLDFALTLKRIIS